MMREVDIRFINFSVFQFIVENFDWQGGLSFYGSQKRDDGADTDLMLQFCLPNYNHYCICYLLMEIVNVVCLY